MSNSATGVEDLKGGKGQCQVTAAPTCLHERPALALKACLALAFTAIGLHYWRGIKEWHVTSSEARKATFNDELHMIHCQVFQPLSM